MKTMKFTKQLFSLLFISSLLFACSKDDGQDGATGPAGPQGEQGIAGPEGSQGETGTANVIYSDWVLAEYALPGAQAENFMGLATLSESDFNIGSDLLLVYAGNNIFSDSFEIFQLPYIHNQNLQFGFGLFGTGAGNNTGLRIQVSTLDGSDSNFTFIDRYRYIIVPGGISTSGKSTLDYTKMTYEEIISHFNIPE